MPNFLRYHQELLPYFVTTNTVDNIWLFKEEKFCQILLDNIDCYRKQMSFKFLDYVIIPWHLHRIFIPFGKYSISDIMRNIKYRTASDIRKLRQLSW